MKKAITKAKLPQGGKRASGYDFFNDFLSFKRTPDKIQILHIDLWYEDGSTGEINITSPHVALGEDLERQYIYMRMYLQKSARDLGVVAYRASVHRMVGDELRTSWSWAKVDCTSIPPYKPGQFCEHE